MVTKVSVQELTVKVETQYSAIVRLHQIFNVTQDFEIEDLYLRQLAVYAKLMQQVKVIAPQLFNLKHDGVLEDITKLEAQLNKPNTVLAPELVAQAELLFDTGVVLGWVEPQPEAIYTCEVCSFKGRLGCGHCRTRIL